MSETEVDYFTNFTPLTDSHMRSHWGANKRGMQCTFDEIVSKSFERETKKGVQKLQFKCPLKEHIRISPPTCNVSKPKKTR